MQLRLVWALAAIALLASCGTPRVATTTEADQPASVDQAASACEAGFRPFTHLRGETCIPNDPQRVVTLQDQNALLPLWELGFRNVVGSVGALTDDGGNYYRRMDRYDTSSVAFVGEYGSPNLEQIALLKPDLIVGEQFGVSEENYAQLSAIAPTVAIEIFTRPVRETSADFAALVNMTDEAAKLEARYQQRVAELRTAFGDPSAITVSMVYFPEPSQIIVDGNAGPVRVFQDIGFAFTAIQNHANASGERQNLGLESLPELDADLIFTAYGSQATREYSLAPPNVVSSALWQNLNAVQKDQTYAYQPEAWYGYAYQPLFNILDFLEPIAAAEIDASWQAVQE